MSRPAEDLLTVRDLVRYAEERPIALVLPSLYSEIHGPALKRIVEELSRVPYLEQCIVSLSGKADVSEYREMRALFEPVRCRDGGGAMVIWNQGPRIRALVDRLRGEGLHAGDDGKGRANWIAYGYVLATHRARVVATHDCDILDYGRDLLARLCYPTANPNMSYEFAKGYYSRVSDRMHGRVTRLFMTPFMRAMKSMLMPLGHTASHSAKLVHEPKLSASICATIPWVRRQRSGWPWGSRFKWLILAEVKS